MRKHLTLWSFVALLVFLVVDLSHAAVRVRRLGDPKSSFYSPDIKTQDDLKKMLQVRREDIRTVLTQAGWRGNVEDLLQALDRGEFSETTISTGSQFPFMAARRGGRPVAMKEVNYEGPAFQAYYVDFESRGEGWRFIAPKICSNFWVEGRAIAKPVEPPPPPAPEPPPPPAPEPPPPPPEPEVVPPPPPEEPPMWFVAAFLGKERRVEIEETAGLGLFADCVTILGVKGGLVPRISDGLEAEVSIGGKFVIGDDDDNGEDVDLDGDDNDHSIFVDAALHGLFSGGFFGGGVSFWDLTNEDLRTISLLLQMGFGSENIQFTVEGRVPFEELDDIENNYMFWAGARFLF